MDNTKSNTLQIKSVDDLGDLQIRAVISAPVVDREGEIIDSSTMQFKSTSDGELAVPLVIDHDYKTRNVIGHVVKQYLNDKGEREAVIQYARTNDGIDSYIKVADGHMKNPYSIGYSYDPEAVKGNTFFGVLVHELSQVVNAANQNSRLVKAFKSLDTKSQKTVQEAYSHKAFQYDVGEDGLPIEESKTFVYDIDCFCVKCDEHRSTEENTMSDTEVKDEVTEATDAVEEVTTETVEQTETATENESTEEVTQEDNDKEKSMSDIDVDALVATKVQEALQAQKDADVAATVVTDAADEAVEGEVVEEATKEDHKVATYKQLNALAKGDFAKVKEYNLKHAKELGIITKNEDLVMNAAGLW